jgi:hypothetical protein
LLFLLTSTSTEASTVLEVVQAQLPPRKNYKEVTCQQTIF